MGQEMTLVEHLAELRQRILVCLVVIFLIALFVFTRVPDIFTVLRLPAAGLIDKLVFFSPTEAFSAYLKVSFFTAIVVSAPLILYQLWAFISTGLGERARKEGILFLILTVAVFYAGIAFGYLYLLPAAIKFLIGFAQGVLEPMISVSEYVSFVTGLLFGCGLVFEMPVLSFLLARMGLLDHRFLRKNWKYAVLAIFIIAAIVTPTPDAFNMCLIAMPMLVLYELSIWVVKLSASQCRPSGL